MEQQFYTAPLEPVFFITNPKKTMWNNSSLAIVAVAAIVLLLIIIMYFVRPPAQEEFSGKSLGEALTKNGWVLFTRTGCGYCQMQMDELGGSYSGCVKCDKPNACPGDINAYPTWLNIITGEKVEGYQTSAQLKKLL